VTHGTATLKETAFFLRLALKTSVPVAMVGAMQPPTLIASGARLNLLNAVRIAASPAAHEMGVPVAMDSTIHSARNVTKAANWQVEFYRRPVRRHTASSELELSPYKAGSMPVVEIVTCYAGVDGASVDAAIARPVDGIVLNGPPPGVAALGHRDAVRTAMERGIAVAQASRALAR